MLLFLTPGRSRLSASDVVLCLQSFPLYSVHCLSLSDGEPKQTSLGNSKAILGIDAALAVLKVVLTNGRVPTCPAIVWEGLLGWWLGVEVNGGEAKGLERILST